MSGRVSVQDVSRLPTPDFEITFSFNIRQYLAIHEIVCLRDMALLGPHRSDRNDSEQSAAPNLH